MPRAGERRHVLILGGTSEAYALAEALAGRADLSVTTSLAGVTAAPRLPAGRLRLGGFGGTAGLGAWLEAEAVDVVVDATHPFAATISRRVRAATALARCRWLRLERPGWQAGPGDCWQRVAALPAGLEVLERLGADRVFAALGARAVAALAGAPRRFVLRGIERPSRLPANVTWLAGRGPFAVEDEVRLLLDQRIEALLCRDSGGEAARAKLDAARQLGLPVVLLDRPPGVGGPTVADVASAVAAIDASV